MCATAPPITLFAILLKVVNVVMDLKASRSVLINFVKQKLIPKHINLQNKQKKNAILFEFGFFLSAGDMCDIPITSPIKTSDVPYLPTTPSGSNNAGLIVGVVSIILITIVIAIIIYYR